MNGRSLLAAVVLGVIACTKAPPPPRVDTTPPADTTPPVPPPAPKVVNRIGMMPITREFPPAPDGQCGVAEEARGRLTYVGDSPSRSVTISIGDPSRRFRPRSIEIKMTQLNGSVTETESLYASFAADGSMEAGTRDFVTSEGPHTRQSVRLSAQDFLDARNVAAQIVRRCGTPR